MLKVIGNVLNMSLDIANFEEVQGFMIAAGDTEVEEIKGQPFIFVGWTPAVIFQMDNFLEYTHSYFSSRFAWYTPCAVKYQQWGRFFKVFSVDMWIFFALSLVLAVITVRCISNYAHKLHLHESNNYTSISSATANITAVVLSVSVNTQPRSAPLRLLFFCWVCYSVAISTVFQAYLTTVLIEPGYEEPIKNKEQMLRSEKNFGLREGYEYLYPDTLEPVDSAIFKDALRCPNDDTCSIWATVNHNISTVLEDLEMKFLRDWVRWTDENKRTSLCELENGVVRTFDYAAGVRKRNPIFEFINDVIGHIIEGAIFMHIKKIVFTKAEMDTEFSSPTFDDTYSVFGVRQLQTALHFLMLGYVLAVVCFVTEIMWHRYWSKGRNRTNISP